MFVGFSVVALRDGGRKLFRVKAKEKGWSRQETLSLFALCSLGRRASELQVSARFGVLEGFRAKTVCHECQALVY